MVRLGIGYHCASAELTGFYRMNYSWFVAYLLYVRVLSFVNVLHGADIFNQRVVKAWAPPKKGVTAPTNSG
jgi:hypothetical protein